MPAVIPHFIPFDSTAFDLDDKATLISYINEEQPDELMNFAIALLCLQKSDLQKVTLIDIGKTGLLLTITQPQTTHTYFLPFAHALHNRDDFQQQYILLIQNSAKVLGKASIELKKRSFILLKKYAITANIVRLVLQSEQDLSHLPAGYAYLLNTPSLNTSQSRTVRYYTLRKAWQEINAQGKMQNLAWIDIYCHGEKHGEISLGETWVKSLKIGDKLTSEREFPEKIDHLGFNAPNNQQAQSLLIADETSLPTATRLLEIWHNPTPPIIMVFLQSEQDLGYLDNVLKDYPATVLPMIADSSQTPHEQIFTTLKHLLQQKPTQIDSVWGGLEATTTKKLRPLLCDLLNLTREKMVLKVYWRNS